MMKIYKTKIYVILLSSLLTFQVNAAAAGADSDSDGLRQRNPAVAGATPARPEVEDIGIEDVNALNADGLAPLHKAARDGDIEAMRRLLVVPNLELNKVDSNGYTPLDWASSLRTGNPVIMRTLLDAGAKSDSFLTHLSIMVHQEIALWNNNRGQALCLVGAFLILYDYYSFVSSS